MPCENCNVQFSFLRRRKRNCDECSRFYCSQCLHKTNNSIYLCDKCVIFTTRPISKVDLLKLKPKDLIFYLQSKHISTAGCVEKEELVDLVLAHIDSENGHNRPPNRINNAKDSPPEPIDNSSNAFDQFKQSCQNFFTNVTGKITSDFNFESKSTQNNANANECYADVNISQPRVSTRVIPSYASSAYLKTSTNSFPNPSTVPIINLGQLSSRNSGPNASTSSASACEANAAKANCEEGSNYREKSTSSSLSSPSSPIVSICSLSSQSLSSQSQLGRRSGENLTIPHSNLPGVPEDCAPSVGRNTPSLRVLDNVLNDGSGSGCECSDDEIITKFQGRHKIPRHSHRNDRFSPSPQQDSAFEDHIPGPSGVGSTTGSGSISKSSNGNQKLSGGSSSSSFEELGAMCAGSPGDSDHWQFVNKTEMNILDDNMQVEGVPKEPAKETKLSQKIAIQPTIRDPMINSVYNIKRPAQKLMRRRSDSSIYTQRYQETSSSSQFPQVNEESDGENSGSSYKRQRKSCKKCGKNKRNLEKCLAKFINQLQTTQMCRDDIRQEADAFLVYLRNRGSFDCSDSDSDSKLQNSNAGSNPRNEQSLTNQSDAIITDSNDLDDGIHVYAQEAPESSRQEGRFMNLWDIKSRDEIDDLSVKQLKEILMLNRVDYKGCCEKQELLERVHRLWNDLKTCPAVDKLEVDDLCKICMDAPIECVMLECGHMATCTNCGKVLPECPICRQYVVRVVRFFRA